MSFLVADQFHSFALRRRVKPRIRQKNAIFGWAFVAGVCVSMLGAEGAKNPALRSLAAARNDGASPNRQVAIVKLSKLNKLGSLFEDGGMAPKEKHPLVEMLESRRMLSASLL